MESNEWSWFRASLADALLRPRRFATHLAREHYGLAGVLIGLLAGLALSVTVDVAVILSKGADPLALFTRLVVDAVFLGLRLLVVLALVALLAVGVARLARREITLDQAFTALSFATAPLFFAPGIVVLMLLAIETTGVVRTVLLGAAAIVGVLFVARVVFGAMVNLAALVRGPASLLVGAAALAAAAFVMQDQVSRVTFTALTYAPELLPPAAATAAEGQVVEVNDVRFQVPSSWVRRSTGAPGVAAQYELPDTRLLVVTTGVSTVTTPAEFASAQAQTERRDFSRIDAAEQRLVRVDSTIAIDQLWRGRIAETPLVERLYTFVVGSRGYVFEFFFYSPNDERAALDEAASIAASITRAR